MRCSTRSAKESTSASCVALGVSGLVITAGIWWVYFAREQHGRLRGMAAGFRFGYLHYVIFAAVGAVSAGVEVEIDEITGHTDVSEIVAGLALTVPVALVIASSWLILLRTKIAPWASALVLVGAVLIFAGRAAALGRVRRDGGAARRCRRGDRDGCRAAFARRQRVRSSDTIGRSGLGRETSVNPASWKTEKTPWYRSFTGWRPAAVSIG